MNYLQHEQLFTDLPPLQASLIAGGAFRPYTTKGVSDTLNIRSGPSLKSRIIGSWRPNQIRYLETPAIIKNGFRRFSSSQSMWVSTQFIQQVFLNPPTAEVGFGSKPPETGFGPRPR